MYHWGAGGAMGWMGLGWLLIAALVVLAVWAVARGAPRGSTGSDDAPREILRRRYAKGEIDRETYERMLRDLGASP